MSASHLDPRFAESGTPSENGALGLSTSIAAAQANPAKPDAPPQRMAIVLTKVRVVRQGMWEYHVPVGSVIGTRILPEKHTFNPGADAKLIAAGDHKPGDIVA